MPGTAKVCNGRGGGPSVLVPSLDEEGTRVSLQAAPWLMA